MASLCVNAESEIFIKKQRNEAEQHALKDRQQQLHAAACRHTGSIRRHNLMKKLHAHGMGGQKPLLSLREFIDITVHRELSPDRNIFTGAKKCISRMTQGRHPCATRHDVSTLKGHDRTCGSTQTSPTMIVDPQPATTTGPQTNNSVPHILYNGTPTPVHPDALDLVSQVKYWQFDFRVGNCRMVPVECPIESPKGRLQSVKARRSVTHAIKKRISVKYRAKNVACQENSSFSVTKSHERTNTPFPYGIPRKRGHRPANV